MLTQYNFNINSNTAGGNFDFNKERGEKNGKGGCCKLIFVDRYNEIRRDIKPPGGAAAISLQIIWKWSRSRNTNEECSRGDEAGVVPTLAPR